MFMSQVCGWRKKKVDRRTHRSRGAKRGRYLETPWLFVAVAAVLSLAAGTASATIVSVDFNDVGTGDLSGKAGGSGFSGNWKASTSKVSVVTGDLAAPTSTHDNLMQTGTALKVSSTYNEDRVVIRDLTTPLTGNVWGSYLVSVSDNDSDAVLAFNYSGTLDPAYYETSQSLVVKGSTLTYAASTTLSTPVADAVPTGETSLILFHLDYDANTFSAWVNPDLAAVLPAADLLSSSIGNVSIAKLVVGGMVSSTGSSYLDRVYLSDGPDAYQDVTGQAFVAPEPSAAMILLGLGTLMMLPRKRVRNNTR